MSLAAVSCSLSKLVSIYMYMYSTYICSLPDSPFSVACSASICLARFCKEKHVRVHACIIICIYSMKHCTMYMHNYVWSTSWLPLLWWVHVDLLEVPNQQTSIMLVTSFVLLHIIQFIHVRNFQRNTCSTQPWQHSHIPHAFLAVHCKYYVHVCVYRLTYMYMYMYIDIVHVHVTKWYVNTCTNTNIHHYHPPLLCTLEGQSESWFASRGLNYTCSNTCTAHTYQTVN